MSLVSIIHHGVGPLGGENGKMPNVTMMGAVTGYNSETVTLQQLGTNMLFHSDRTILGSDFSGVIAETGIHFIRYPGGTLSEEYFDIADPNSEIQSNILDAMSGAAVIREQNVTPLGEFLAYSQEIHAKSSIVLPTYRYFDPETGGIRPEAEAQIREFTRNLLTGGYGTVEGVTLEIGNEWYQHRFGWSIEQFGQLQATISSWINDEADILGLRNNVTLLAQAGRSSMENNILSSFFEDPNGPSIDGVLTHFYGTNSSGNPLGIGGGIDTRLDQINGTWSTVLGPDFQLAVTEWNVGESGEASTLINGLMRLAPLMRIYTTMLSRGVDLAMIWSAQTHGSAGLSSTEGTGSDLSVTGYFYSMLLHSIQGMRLVDTGESSLIQNNSGATVGYTYTFEHAQNIVNYFVSGSDVTIPLVADLSGYYTSGAYVYAAVLGAAPGESGISYDAHAAIRYVTGIDLSTGTGREWLFEHQLTPYELVELHVVVGAGVTILGDTQNAIDDTLIGSQYADNLFGNLGNDTLTGNDGNDYLDGGDGSDQLSGGNGDDTLNGGPGNDYLQGGNGRDFLDGGLGDDILNGGNWDDTLNGGPGDDTLKGGNGRDFLDGGLGDDTLDGGDWNDTLVGGEGNDILSGGKGNDTLTGNDGDDYLDGGDGNDQLSGGSGSNILKGGEGNDTLIGGTGNDILSGENGDDLLKIGDGGGLSQGGTGIDTLSAINVTRGVTVWNHHGNGVMELGNGNLNTFTGIEIFQGTLVDDRFSIDSDHTSYFGEDGDDVFEFRDGADNLVNMGSGNDLALIYQNNNSQIFGGSGNDQFMTFAGDNRLIGGTGDDTFQLSSNGRDTLQFNAGDGADRVTGFHLGTDLIEFHELSAENMHTSVEVSGTLLSFGTDGSILLEGVFNLDLSAGLLFL